VDRQDGVLKAIWAECTVANQRSPEQVGLCLQRGERLSSTQGSKSAPLVSLSRQNATLPPWQENGGMRCSIAPKTALR
jgi:hypothetical protein